MAPDPNTLPQLDASLRKLARRLVADAARADDVVQDAWLAALRREEGTVVSWAAWLSKTVRSLTGRARRADDRRERRETSVAVPEAVPSAAELVERESVRRRVVDALLALPDPYRTALALRFFDDLPPRKIAARLGIPTETARTRIKQGVERLRERLDADFGGDRRAWGLALAPLAVPKATALGAALTTAGEVLLMNVATKIGLATVALCGITWIVLTLTDVPGGVKKDLASVSATTTSNESDVLRRSAASAESVTATRAPTDAKLEPASAAAPPPATTGALEITLKFASDGAPGAGVGLVVHRANERDPSWSVFTDQHGIARLEGLPPGEFSVDPDRDWTHRSAKIVAGDTEHLNILMDSGALIEGVVLTPERNPVGGAEIFLSQNQYDPAGFVVAHTTPDGKFAIRDVRIFHSIGARAAGYAPSPIRHVRANAGGRVALEFVLRGRGGAVAGHVVDEQQRPIANAELELTETCVGETVNGNIGRANVFKFEDGDFGFIALGIRTTTDEHGAFAFESVAPASHTLVVRAPGFAVASVPVACAEGARVTKDFRLLPTPTLRGRVVDGRGEPEASASISIAGYYALEHMRTQTTKEGEFTLETLPAGTVGVHVQTSSGMQHDQSVTLTAGVETSVEIKLPEGGAIRGRVVDDVGVGRDGFVVQAYAGEGVRTVHTGSDGAFTLLDCRDMDYRLTIAQPGLPDGVCAVRVVRPSADEVLITVPNSALPSAKIIVRVTDDLGQPFGGADVVTDRPYPLMGMGRSTDADTGICVFDSIVPDLYQIGVSAPGFARVDLGSRRVKPNETVEYDVQLARPGTLIAQFVDVNAEEAASIKWVEVVGADAHMRRGLDAGTSPTIFEAKDLPPGRWALVAYSPEFYFPPVMVEIRSGSETRVDVPHADGVDVTIRVPAFEPQTEVICRIVDLDGAMIEQQRRWSKANKTPLEFKLTLPPGSYDVHVFATETELEAPLDVATEPVTVELDPK